MDLSNVLLVGVDGGATAIKAHAVTCGDFDTPADFALRPESSTQVYPRIGSFSPAPLGLQLSERETQTIELAPAEREQGKLWVTTAAAAIEDVSSACDNRRVLVGIGMPGLKTEDRRGISAMNNGPRIPDYLESLERDLAERGVDLVAPIAGLGSDADYCGLGEEYAALGLFHDVDNAYYVGCGTGIADALKLRGELVPFDEAREWIQKSWQITSAIGPTFEKLVSASWLNRVYARMTEAAWGEGDEASQGPYPEVKAAAGNADAVAWMHTAALVVSELIFERMWTIKNGRPDVPHRGNAYARCNAEHEYRGVLLDRAIVGQRLGLIYASKPYRHVFGEKLEACLAGLIASSGDKAMCAEYLTETSEGPLLNTGFLMPSKVRAAPAIGAAVAAVRAVE